MGEARYSFTLLTKALIKVSGQVHAPAILTKGNTPPLQLPIKYEAGVGEVGGHSRNWGFEEEKISCPCRELNHDSLVA